MLMKNINTGTFKSRRLLLILQFMAVFSWAALQLPSLHAQFTSRPQASTQEEYDQYLSVLAASNSHAVIAAAESFEKSFPKSEMLPNVFKMELEAWIANGDAKNAILAGEKGLQLAPKNIDLLSELAYLIADTQSDPSSLDKSESLANTALELLGNLQIPRVIKPKEWEMIRGPLESKAHSALGLVEFKRGLLPEAIDQFESALQPGVADETPIFYRLGRLYLLTGQIEKARLALMHAATSGVPELRREAEKELTELPSK